MRFDQNVLIAACFLLLSQAGWAQPSPLPESSANAVRVSLKGYTPERTANYFLNGLWSSAPGTLNPMVYEVLSPKVRAKVPLSNFYTAFSRQRQKIEQNKGSYQARTEGPAPDRARVIGSIDRKNLFTCELSRHDGLWLVDKLSINGAQLP